jgi:hypothetical protein
VFGLPIAFTLCNVFCPAGEVGEFSCHFGSSRARSKDDLEFE